MTPRMEPIKDASAWTGDDLQHDQSWKFSLTPQQKADLDKALQQVKDRGLQSVVTLETGVMQQHP